MKRFQVRITVRFTHPHHGMLDASAICPTEGEVATEIQAFMLADAVIDSIIRAGGRIVSDALIRRETVAGEPVAPALWL